MHRGVRAVALLAFGTLSAACGGNTAGTSGGGAAGDAAHAVAGAEVAPPAGSVILAKVGSTGGVTSEDFAEAASRTPPRNGQQLTPEERHEILEKLIVEEALFQEAAKRGLHRDPKVRKIMVNLLMRDEVTSNVKASDFSPEQMRAYFDTHRDEFVVPEKVQIMRIFLKVGETRSAEQAMTLARELRAKVVANPESFKELAQQHSDDPYKRRGGDLGYLPIEGKPGIDPAVVSTAFGMQVGQVSEPFEAGGGVNILYVPQKRERVERTFEQMKGSVLRKLKNERYKELTEAYITSVRAQYPVETDEAALASAPVKPTRPQLPVEDGEEPHDEAEEHHEGDPAEDEQH